MMELPTHKEQHGQQLELLLFNGEDRHGWLAKVEHYFRMKGINEAERVSVIQLSPALITTGGVNQS